MESPIRTENEREVFPIDFISIRVREDNLMYLFFADDVAFSVDSFSPRAIEHALSCTFDKQNYTEREIMKLSPCVRRRQLKCALTTHGHFDHAGGNEELAKLSPGTRFVDCKAVEDGQSLGLPPFSIMVLKTPCHTLDSVCYYVTRGCRKYLLTGDYLFKLGCGRFFEGTPELFLSSLKKLIGNVSDDTLMLYGHDYCSTNRRFAEQFYPVRGCDDFFLTFGQERRFNPFLNHKNCTIPGKGGQSDEEVIGILRSMKDSFR